MEAASNEPEVKNFTRSEKKEAEEEESLEILQIIEIEQASGVRSGVVAALNALQRAASTDGAPAQLPSASGEVYSALCERLLSGMESFRHCGHCGNCIDDRESLDVTKDVQMVLSCVIRMGQKFGKMMTAQVLTGSRNKKILDFGFDKLSTYGILKHHSAKEVKYIERKKKELALSRVGRWWLRSSDHQ